MNKKSILPFFVTIRHHQLPLTNYLINGQSAKVQPIASKFIEPCIQYLLATTLLALKVLIYAE